MNDSTIPRFPKMKIEYMYDAPELADICLIYLKVMVHFTEDK